MLRWVFVGFCFLSVIGTWFVVILAFVRGWGPYIRSKRQKKVAVNARVKEKRGHHEFDPINWQHQIIQKTLVFECEDGVERNYDVHDDIFDWLEAGDDGVLVYQGHLFVEFEARRAKTDFDIVYKRLTRT